MWGPGLYLHTQIPQQYRHLAQVWWGQVEKGGGTGSALRLFLGFLSHYLPNFLRTLEPAAPTTPRSWGSAVPSQEHSVTPLLSGDVVGAVPWHPQTFIIPPPQAQPRPGVTLTLAVSEVQSLVPLGTLQLAIFNHWGG